MIERPLSLAQQWLHLKSSKIYAGQGQLSPGLLEWRFQTRPTPLSRDYSVLLRYRLDRRPSVIVEDPDLPLLAEGRRLPHVYQDRPPHICLYLPGSGEWTPQKIIADTILPWTDLWLFHFEEWLWSDDWKGGGEHPSDDDHVPRHLRRRYFVAMQS